MVERTEPDGTIKRRLILNLKKSGATAAAAKVERVMLPAPIDVVCDCLDLLAIAEEWEDVEAIVLDFPMQSGTCQCSPTREGLQSHEYVANSLCGYAHRKAADHRPPPNKTSCLLQ